MHPENFAAKQYFAMEHFYAARLAGQLNKNWDAVVAPPSSRPWARPYLEAAKSMHPAIDLTPRFTRVGPVRSGDPTTSMDEVIASLAYQARGDESGFATVLCIDDVLASGKTIAAIVHLLRQHGLPSSAVFQVAVALWIPAGTSSS